MTSNHGISVTRGATQYKGSPLTFLEAVGLAGVLAILDADVAGKVDGVGPDRYDRSAMLKIAEQWAKERQLPDWQLAKCCQLGRKYSEQIHGPLKDAVGKLLGVVILEVHLEY